MPEIPVKEGRLPELRLPEISRDEIIRSFSEIRRPDMDLSQIEWPKVDLPQIEWPKVDLSHIEWSRKNREAGRPFIEHQLEIIDFQVAMQQATERAGHRFIDAGEIVATRSSVSRNQPDPFAMRVAVTHDGRRHEIGLVPDLGFALGLASGARRNFLVEIDRGSMPITRSDFSQTSIERKLRCYLAANAVRLPERQFEWKAVFAELFP